MYELSEPNMERRIIKSTKEHLLPDEASKLPHSVNRVPFPQDKLQLVTLRPSLTILEDRFRVKIMRDEIRGFQEQVNVRWACAP
jgi:hypothetical protein